MTKYQPVQRSEFGVPTAVTKQTFPTKQKALDFIAANPSKFRSGRAGVIETIEVSELSVKPQAAKAASKKKAPAKRKTSAKRKSTAKRKTTAKTVAKSKTGLKPTSASKAGK